MDRTKSRGAMWGLLALVVTIGLMGSALAGGAALAAKGGNSATGCKGGPKHGCGGTTSTVTLTVSPNPPTTQGFLLSGTGFTPYAAVNFVQSGSATFVMANESGYASTPWVIALPGTYTITAEENTGGGFHQVGSITFNVVQ